MPTRSPLRRARRQASSENRVGGLKLRSGLVVLSVTCLALSACRSVLAIFFDVPRAQPASKGGPPPPPVPGSTPVPAGAAGDSTRPPIELLLDPDSARALLPQDAAGNVDWMTALRTGVIRPRPGLPGEPVSTDPNGFRFAFDFLIRGPDSTFDAFFPHSAHTEWLACQQCHPRNVAYRNTTITMTDVLQGRYCGECHGKVAFPAAGPVEGCERCHRKLRAAAVTPDTAAAGTSPAGAAGKAVYQRWCAMCHGDTGAGDGRYAANLVPRPRDFTTGVYKLRSTPTGELPTDADLRRVVDNGIPGTAMPGWRNKLTDRERQDVIAYIKTFSSAFEGSAPAPVSIGPPPPTTPAGIALGRGQYEKMQCFKCHGPEGRGDGRSAPTLKDDAGVPIRPADLTQGWQFRGHGSVEDIYTRLRTGLDGTPMPSYSDVLEAGVISDEQLWRLAQYVRSLSAVRSSLGDLEIRLRRVTSDSSVAASDTIGFAAGVRTDSLARARFPHWLHRIRYRCKACHMTLTEPKAGANAVTMKAISRGEVCGRCHDGRTAFRAGFGECQRCHTPTERPGVAPNAGLRQ